VWRFLCLGILLRFGNTFWHMPSSALAQENPVIQKPLLQHTSVVFERIVIQKNIQFNFSLVWVLGSIHDNGVGEIGPLKGLTQEGEGTTSVGWFTLAPCLGPLSVIYHIPHKVFSYSPIPTHKCEKVHIIK
jgi:hypothetical protein